MTTHCGDHSGVCTDMESCKRRLDKMEVNHDDCEKSVVKNKLFYTLITVLLVLFTAIFGMGWTVAGTIGRVEQEMKIQAVKLANITEDVKDIKDSLK